MPELLNYAALIDRCRELAAQATPGPWVSGYYDGAFVARENGAPGIIEPGQVGQDDAAFIAEARTAVPELVRQVERLSLLLDESERQLEDARQVLNKIQWDADNNCPNCGQGHSERIHTSNCEISKVLARKPVTKESLVVAPTLYREVTEGIESALLKEALSEVAEQNTELRLQLAEAQWVARRVLKLLELHVGEGGTRRNRNMDLLRDIRAALNPEAQPEAGRG